MYISNISYGHLAIQNYCTVGVVTVRGEDTWVRVVCGVYDDDDNDESYSICHWTDRLGRCFW